MQLRYQQSLNEVRDETIKKAQQHYEPKVQEAAYKATLASCRLTRAQAKVKELTSTRTRAKAPIEQLNRAQVQAQAQVQVPQAPTDDGALKPPAVDTGLGVAAPTTEATLNMVVDANRRASVQQEVNLQHLAAQQQFSPGSVVTTQAAPTLAGRRGRGKKSTRAAGPHSYATRANISNVSPTKGARASFTQASLHGELPGDVQVINISDDVSQMDDTSQITGM